MLREICYFVRRAWCALTVRPLFSWRRLVLYARGVEYGRDVCMEANATIDGQGRAVLGNNVFLGRGAYIHVWKGATLVIEDDTYIGRGTIVLVHSSVKIGRESLIAPFCHITDVNHGMARGLPMRKQALSSQPIEIGADVWFGAGCSVLPGVRIGRGCVIGARAVVTKDLPEYAIAVGIPARPVKFRPAGPADRPVSG